MQDLCAVFLLLVLFVVYSPALHGSYLWDDSRHIPDRPSLYTPTGLKLIWTQPGYTQQYYPLMFTTVWVEHHLWGASPLGYHLVTLFFHGCNAILVALLLTELGFPGAWWVAFLFALHPIQVESVAWMTELKNTQSTFFYLLALLTLLRFPLPAAASGERGCRSWFYYALAIFLYLCALSSKTISCTLPAVAMVLLWYRNDCVRTIEVLQLLPFFGAGLALASVTSGFEKNILGAAGPAWDFTFYEHFLIVGRAFWFYIGKLLWPHPLNFTYPLWEVHRWGKANILFPIAVVLLFGVLWRGRRRWGKAPFAAMAIFAACLSPALGLVHLYPMRYSFVADHFQYQAGIGVIALAVAVIWRLGYCARVAVLTVLCVGSGLATWNRAHVYRDPEVFYQDILSKYPTCVMAMDNLARAFLSKGAVPEARACVTRAFQEDPNDLDAQILMGNLLLYYDHRPLAARPYYEQACRQISDFYPSHSKQGYLFALHAQLAETYFEAKQFPEAEKLFQTALGEIPALAQQPYYDFTPEGLTLYEGEYRYRLAAVLEEEGKYREASRQFNLVLRLPTTNRK
jgi:tetratricopeptide (TPR) repeat protein